ncbi:MAG: hypothetical protein AB7U18_15840, partial [Dehalococcoidia bacterium]
MVRARRARDAGITFRETVALVLRCITGDGLFVAPGTSSTRGHSQLLTFQTERARRRGRLFLSIEHEFIVEEDAHDEPLVTILSYIFTIYDGQERRLLGYHYHPEGRGEASVPFPHLHIYGDFTAA